MQSLQAHLVNTMKNTQKTLSYSIDQLLGGGFLHFDVGEEFLASVLQAGTKEVDDIVDDKKTVMIALAYPTEIMISRL